MKWMLWECYAFPTMQQEFLADLKREGYTCVMLILPRRIQGWDYQRTVKLALPLQPATREIVCVAGTGTEEQAWNNEARKVLERFATRAHARWLDKLPLQAVLGEVAWSTPFTKRASSRKI
jgi:hypothetical protein